MKPSKDDAEPSPLKGSLLSALWPSIGAEFLALYRTVPAPPASSVACAPGAQLLRRLPARWRVPSPPAVASATRFSLSSPTPSDAPEYSWVGSTARAIGTVVHAECAGWPRRPAARRPTIAVAAGAGSRAARAGICEPCDQRSVAAHTEDARGRWLLSDQHREAHSEWRLTGLHQGRIVNVIFDRMLVDEHGQRWVIDYKTSTHQGGAIDAFIDQEAQRYHAQMQRYAALAARIDDAPVRVALYFPLLGVFRELALVPGGP